MDVIDLLERIGRDATLSRASTAELRRALAAMDVSDDLIAAVMAADDRGGQDGQPPCRTPQHVVMHPSHEAPPAPPKPDEDTPGIRPSR